MMRTFWVLSFLVLALILAGACGARRSVDRAVIPAGVVDQTIPARVLTVDVDEKNLAVANQSAGRDYLRKMLVGLLARKLTNLGFEPQSANQLAAGGTLEDFNIHGHREKVRLSAGTKNKVVRKKLWDVRGRLRVLLTDTDVGVLGQQLGALPVVSIESAQKAADYLAGYTALGPERTQLDAWRLKLGKSWQELLEHYLTVRMDVAVTESAAYLQALDDAAGAVGAFLGHFPKHQALTKLEKVFSLAALKWVRGIELNTENHPRIENRIQQVADKIGHHLPGVIAYLHRDYELAWRDRLKQRDDTSTEFPALRQEFLLFLDLFPQSDFYPELELRFLARWVGYLLSSRPDGLGELLDFAQQVLLCTQRFPSYAQLDEVRAALGKQCLAVLAQEQPVDLTQMTEVKKAVSHCRLVWPQKEGIAIEARITAIEDRLLKAKEDRREKVALKDLTFFVDWDQAVASLAWGRGLKEWPMGDGFAQKWDRGEDAGPDCQCTLDPDEPCRVFDSEGAHGGFEVVARFFEGRLNGVDLCQVYVGSNLPALYRFFARRYRKTHSSREAAAFLTGNSGLSLDRVVGFANAKEKIVTLACATGMCTIRYRYAPLYRAQQQQENQDRIDRKEGRERQRAARVAQGWQIGDCVKWACRGNCRFQGQVKSKQAQKYLLTITRSERDPREVGKRKWILGSELYDCR